MNYSIGMILETKKTHVCGSSKWEVVRIGADVKIKCLGCERVIMVAKRDLDKKIKVSSHNL